MRDQVPEGFLSEDAKYAISILMPEMARDFEQYSKEYQEPRELGVKAEFVEIHRKTKKLKLAFWEGVDTSDWRESPRQILKELASHCLLAIKDIDDAEAEAEVEAETSRKEVCGMGCTEGHTYGPKCAVGVVSE